MSDYTLTAQTASRVRALGIDLDDRASILKHYMKLLELVNETISKSIQSNVDIEIQAFRMETIFLLRKFVNVFDIRDYLLLDSTPHIPESIFYDSLFTLGTLYKTYVETEVAAEVSLRRQNEANRTSDVKVFSKRLEDMFREGLGCFTTILRVRFDDDLALKQLTSIYTYMSLFADDLNVCLGYMQEALLYVSENPTIHYNLGYIYQRMNRMELSLIHYKISLGLLGEQLTSNSDNGGNANTTNTNADNNSTYNGTRTTNKRNQKSKGRGNSSGGGNSSGNSNSNSVSDREAKIELTENDRLKINNYNGISAIYRSLKQWPQSLHYLLKAERINSLDPDIQNQLGVVYTEMRRTDLAERAYTRGIENYKRTFVSTDDKFLLAEMYLNFGHMHSYNGSNQRSIECYNKSLQTCPKFTLPFQNKIMNLNYLFDELDDKMYITNQHRLVNRLYKKQPGRYTFTRETFTGDRIHIGIISGDFVDHPVSFFISTFLRRFDTKRFRVTCYSECIINTGLYNKELEFRTIRNMSAEAAADLIYNDRVHVLFDLAGHTAFNRMDVFALRPSPVQVTYIGYPFTTGLDEMDYRITDNVCDGDFSVSQKFYSERLVALDNCFLCYDPTVINNTGVVNKPLHEIRYRDRDGFVNIGCFNRTNKITDGMIRLLNGILLKFPKTRLVFKTKGLINKIVRAEFVSKFDRTVQSRIVVLECTITHDDHLLTYNDVDIAVDTFPYSGTTTTCEALYMGVPVYSVYDKTYYFHPQNVSCSILKNSGLEEYIVEDTEMLFRGISNFVQHSNDQQFWRDLKTSVRKRFTEGLVCNQEEYMKNFQNLVTRLYTERVENLDANTCSF